MTSPSTKRRRTRWRHMLQDRSRTVKTAFCNMPNQRSWIVRQLYIHGWGPNTIPGQFTRTVQILRELNKYEDRPTDAVMPLP